MAKNSCQKKPNFLEILGTKVVQFWCYTKLIKTKKLLLNWYFSTKIFFRKIRRIFDVENRLWKSDFGTFWRLFLAIQQVSWKNQYLFFDQCNDSFNLKCFYQIPLTWWKTYFYDVWLPFELLDCLLTGVFFTNCNLIYWLIFSTNKLHNQKDILIDLNQTFDLNFELTFVGDTWGLLFYIEGVCFYQIYI